MLRLNAGQPQVLGAQRQHGRVEIVTEDIHQAYFGVFANNSTQRVRAHAAATIQPIAAASAPYVVCGNASSGGYDFLDSTGKLKPLSTLLPIYGHNGTHADYGPDLPSGPGGETLIIEENAPAAKNATPPYDPTCNASGSSTDGQGTEAPSPQVSGWTSPPATATRPTATSASPSDRNGPPARRA